MQPRTSWKAFKIQLQPTSYWRWLQIFPHLSWVPISRSRFPPAASTGLAGTFSPALWGQVVWYLQKLPCPREGTCQQGWQQAVGAGVLPQFFPKGLPRSAPPCTVGHEQPPAPAVLSPGSTISEQRSGGSGDVCQTPSIFRPDCQEKDLVNSKSSNSKRRGRVSFFYFQGTISALTSASWDLSKGETLGRQDLNPLYWAAGVPHDAINRRYLRTSNNNKPRC